MSRPKVQTSPVKKPVKTTQVRKHEVVKLAAQKLQHRKRQASIIRQPQVSGVEPEGVKKLAQLFTGILSVCASGASADKILNFDIIGSAFGLDKNATSVGINDAFDEFVKGMKPRDPLEKLALEQLLLNHVRTLSLCQQACAQTSPEMIKILNEAADRASGAFRRLMAAFSEYRKPRQSIVAIGQANVASQQIVQNVDAQRKKPANELELKPMKTLPCREDTD
jgi:hypothetical protein